MLDIFETNSLHISSWWTNYSRVGYGQTALFLSVSTSGSQLMESLQQSRLQRILCSQFLRAQPFIAGRAEIIDARALQFDASAETHKGNHFVRNDV